MQRQEKNQKDSKEFRPAAMARPRRIARAHAFRRRTGFGTQMAIPMGEEVSLARELWDGHALKAGMGLFWGWFLVANWHNLHQVAGSLLG